MLNDDHLNKGLLDIHAYEYLLMKTRSYYQDLISCPISEEKTKKLKDLLRSHEFIVSSFSKTYQEQEDFQWDELLIHLWDDNEGVFTLLKMFPSFLNIDESSKIKKNFLAFFQPFDCIDIMRNIDYETKSHDILGNLFELATKLELKFDKYLSKNLKDLDIEGLKERILSEPISKDEKFFSLLGTLYLLNLLRNNHQSIEIHEIAFLVMTKNCKFFDLF